MGDRDGLLGLEGGSSGPGKGGVTPGGGGVTSCVFDCTKMTGDPVTCSPRTWFNKLGFVILFSKFRAATIAWGVWVDESTLNRMSPLITTPASAAPGMTD